MKKSEEILYIVMPAYNEGENIRETVESWIKILDDKSKKSRLVIADSGSVDNTHEILLSLKKKYRNLEVLEKTEKQHGPKVIALYNYAIRQGADYIFQTDSDGQTNPSEFDAFWKMKNQYGAVLGHRVHRGDGKARALVEKVVCFLLRLFFDVKVPDANAPFRLMRASLVEKYLPKLPKNYDLPNVILTAYFARFKESIAFEPVSFKPRTAGVNSVNLKKIFKIGKDSLTNFARFRKDMVTSDPKLAKTIRINKLKSFLIASSLTAMACLAVSTSPSSPWNRSETVTDSGVFLTVGTQIKNGLTPYLDTFDHKGPFLYIINYLGVLINPTSGILIFEFIALIVALIYMYKIARLKIRNRGYALFLVSIVFSLYLTLNTIDRGNLTEEYALPFLTFAIFVFLDYFQNNKTTHARVFLLGLSFACVALLRLNMVAIWCVLCLAVLVKLVKGKQFSELGRFIVDFISGAFIVCVPIFIWIVSKGALQAFLDTYIHFNTLYSKVGAISILATILFFLEKTLIIAGVFLALAYSFLDQETVARKTTRIFLATFLFAILAACMSGRQFPHYGIVLIPLIIYPFAILYSKFESAPSGREIIIVVSTLLFLLAFPAWKTTLRSAAISYSNRSVGEPVANSIKAACDYTNLKTSESDRIAVFGNRDYIYLRCNRLPASKYSYQYPISEVRPAILDEFFADISATRPKLFFVQAGYNTDRVLDYLKANDYEEIWHDGNENGDRIFIPKD
ncbi:glycosyltransferase [Candidatus Saccharibacteria bacterium]|nr:glycosyltransferase [Candidatus Saccharibacteria bacterium]